MAMITTSNIPGLLIDGAHAVFSDYLTYKTDWEAIFSKNTSHRNFEREYEMEMLGPAQLKYEGQGGSYSSMQQMFETNYVHQSFQIGFIITNEALSDNLYKDQFPRSALALKNSMAETKNIQGANVLNNGFNSSYAGGDGQPLFSTAHPVIGNMFANTFTTGADLSQTSLENAITAIGQFRTASNLRSATKPVKLIVPQELQWTAKKLLGSKFAPDTANNAINTVYDDVLPGGFRINHFLTNPNAWFIITDNDNGLKYFQRENIRIDTFPDIDSDSLKVRAIERYSFNWSDSRGAFGSQGI